jgi:hypothetical protein
MQNKCSWPRMKSRLLTTAGVARTFSPMEFLANCLKLAFSASPVLIDGKIYAIGEDGEVFIFLAATF